MATKREKELYRMVFNSVLNSYLELKSVIGTLSCTGLYESVGRQGAGKTTFNSSVIRPLPSDFICEVDRIALLNLDEDDYRLYYNHYQYNQSDQDWRPNKHRIQEILGKQFIKRQIHPIEQYFKPKDTR